MDEQSIYDEDGDERNADIQNKYKYLIHSVHLTIAKYNNRNVNGRWWPAIFDKLVSIPKKFQGRVINPLNDDKYCFFYSILLTKFYDKKEANLASYWIKNKKELTEIVEKCESSFDKYYDEHDKFMFSVKNLQKVEDEMGINLHIYSVYKNELVCCFRSEFRQEKNKNVIRLLNIPYSEMSFNAAAERSQKKKNQIIEEYHVGEASDNEELVEIKDAFDHLVKNNHGHFTLIANPEAFFDKSKHNYPVCRFCDHVFVDLSKHEPNCQSFLDNNFTSNDRCTNLKANEEGSIIEFKDQYLKTKLGFIIYADTETISIEGEHRMISYMLYVHCSFNPEFSRSKIYTAESERDMKHIYQRFMNDLTELRIHCTNNSNLKKMYTRLDRIKFMESYVESDDCLLCSRNFDEVFNEYEEKKKKTTKKKKLADGVEVQEEEKEVKKVHRKVLHHDHNTGEIKGYVCHSCNMNETKSHTISICFHNLPFDLLVILKSFAFNKFDGYDMRNSFNILAKSSQKYSSLTVKTNLVKGEKKIRLYPLKFIDSYAFMRSSLDKIIKTMVSGADGGYRSEKEIRKILPITYKYFSEKYDDDFFDKCCVKKGALAYDKITIESLKNKTNFDEMDYVSSLGINYKNYTGIEDFDRQVRMKFRKSLASNKKYYEQSCLVWNKLSEWYGNEMTMKIYFDFYLELDVYLMADFFESLRNNCYKTHKLDIAYCQGLASYSQKSYLNFTKKKLNLIPDLSLSQLLIENMRGGFSGVLNKISENMAENEKKMIWYLDVNNLYGLAMTQKLANKYIGSFEFSEEMDKEMKANKDNNFAYFLLIDYVIPTKIHDKLMKFPPLISKKTIENRDVSSYNKSIKFCESGKDLISAYQSTKLCSTLENGTNYLCAYDNYVLYKEVGYEIKINRIFKFEAEYLMKSYIELNTKLRQENSHNELFKQFYKDLNNIIFGKNLENPLKYKNFELFGGDSSENIIQKRVNSPLHKNHRIIVDDELVLIESNKKEVCFNTPIQVGFHILEKSKLHMYSSLYRNFIPFFEKYNIEWKILMHDTDSFCFELNLENSKFENEKAMMLVAKKDSLTNNLFDLHMYKDPEIHDSSRKKAVGYFLDEFSDQSRITGFIGLCAKSYTYLEKNLSTGETKQEIKGKGVPKAFMEDLFSFETYKQLIENKKLDNNEISFTNLQKKNFSNVMSSQSKKILSLFDDKFYFVKKNGAITMFPYGHFMIAKIEKALKKKRLIKDESEEISDSKR